MKRETSDDGILSAIENCEIFASLSADEKAYLANRAMTVRYEKGQSAIQCDGISLISSGKFGVYSLQGKRRILLNTLYSRDCFGFASMYSSSPNEMTVIVSKSVGEIVFIPTVAIECVANNNGAFALRIIKILAEKIRFLSSRIDSYLSVSAEEKLYKYLKKCDGDDSGYIVIEDKMSYIADNLGIGRASLYRAMDSLIKSGKIISDENGIKLVK